jgi:hypothetical protein
VVSLADDDMQVGLPGGLGVADALLEDVLGFFDKLAVQVDGVLGDAARSVVLTKDELRGLLVVVCLFLLVALAFVRELLGSRAVATLIGLVSLYPAVHNESTIKRRPVERRQRINHAMSG